MSNKVYYKECSCKYCNKEFSTINGLNGHIRYCKFNPTKKHAWNKGLSKDNNENVLKYTKSMTETKNSEKWKSEHIIWNKGLTKETSTSVAKYTDSMKITKSAEEWKQQLDISIRNKYNGKHYTQTDEYKETCKKKCLERYGVTHPMHVQHIFDKTLNSTYRRKEYKLPSGVTIKIQGYENYAYDHIFANGYSESDIEFDLPKILYTYDGKSRRYYPDIYIKTENLIIEVKSTYTMECNKERNILKHQATIDNGYDHEFWIVIPHKEIYKVRDVNEYYTRTPMGRNNIRRI